MHRLMNPFPDTQERPRIGRLNFWTLVIFSLLIFSTVFIVFPFGKLFLHARNRSEWKEIRSEYRQNLKLKLASTKNLRGGRR